MRSHAEFLERHRASSCNLLLVFFLLALSVLSESGFCQESYFSLYPDWKSNPGELTHCIALGDVDNDGDLDLVCGNYDESNTFYLNTGGTFETSPSWSSEWLGSTT